MLTCSGLNQNQFLLDVEAAQTGGSCTFYPFACLRLKIVPKSFTVKKVFIEALGGSRSDGLLVGDRNDSGNYHTIT